MIDNRLIATWNNGGSRLIEIKNAGELFVIGNPQPYSITNNDQRLTFLNTNPIQIFDRLTSGNSIVGVWERYETVNGDNWREEWNIRSDGSYSTHFTLNGTPDTFLHGVYANSSGHFTSREHRATVATNGSNMTMAQFFGPIEQGTYTVANDEQSWIFNGPNGAITHTRVTDSASLL